MSKKISFFLLLASILLLNGCGDEWDDLVDSITGSGDDKSSPVEEKAARESTATARDEEEAAALTYVLTDLKATGSGEEEVAETPEVAETQEEAETQEAAATREEEPEPEATGYASEFHHTTTASSDGGKSLVMCPGHVPNFDRCSVGDVDIPYHGYDKGRVSYWNMEEEPRGDIICVKNGKSYRYRADSTIVYGSCG